MHQPYIYMCVYIYAQSPQVFEPKTKNYEKLKEKKKED